MANYLYNGTSLPDINEVWTDKATNPYGAIVQGVTGGTYHLNLNAEPLMATASGEMLYGEYTLSSSGWVENQTPLMAGKVIWANHDIYTADGTLYLAASDPLPVGTPITDPLSFIMGYQIGCRLRVQRAVKKPVGYLYNGVLLPELPEVEGFEYKVMRSYRKLVSYNPITYADVYELYVLNVRPYKKADYENLGIPTSGNLRSATCTNGIWSEFGAETSINTAWGGYIPFWTNTDILNEDGSVFLAKSEPVPVYE